MSQLEKVVLEVERHAAQSGWDQPASLFALVETAELLQKEPQLAEVLGVGDDRDDGLTPVEQDPLSETVEELLGSILWPPDVAGCAVVLEATTQTSSAAAQAEEARIVAGALRSGETFCAIRSRGHDADELVLTGPDLVPGLLQLLHATLDPDAGDAPEDETPMTTEDDTTHE